MDQVKFVITELEKIKIEHGDLYLVMQDFDGNEVFASDIDTRCYVKYKNSKGAYNPLFDNIKREITTKNNKETDIERINKTGHTVVEDGICIDIIPEYDINIKHKRMKISQAIEKIISFNDKSVTELSTGGKDEFFEEIDLGCYYILQNDWHEYNQLEVDTEPDEYFEKYYEEEHKGGKRGIEKGKCVYVR